MKIRFKPDLKSEKANMSKAGLCRIQSGREQNDAAVLIAPACFYNANIDSVPGVTDEKQREAILERCN